jgi:hypothetical protein
VGLGARAGDGRLRFDHPAQQIVLRDLATKRLSYNDYLPASCLG